MDSNVDRRSPSWSPEFQNSLETFQAWREGEPWAQCQRVLMGLRAQCLERAARASSSDQWNLWRGWVFCLDHILTGALEHEARRILGLDQDEILDSKPVQDYLRRDGEPLDG